MTELVWQDSLKAKIKRLPPDKQEEFVSWLEGMSPQERGEFASKFQARLGREKPAQEIHFDVPGLMGGSQQLRRYITDPTTAEAVSTMVEPTPGKGTTGYIREQLAEKLKGLRQAGVAAKSIVSPFMSPEQRGTIGGILDISTLGQTEQLGIDPRRPPSGFEETFRQQVGELAPFIASVQGLTSMGVPPILAWMLHGAGTTPGGVKERGTAAVWSGLAERYLKALSLGIGKLPIGEGIKRQVIGRIAGGTGFALPDFLIPQEGEDPNKWASRASSWILGAIMMSPGKGPIAKERPVAENLLRQQRKLSDKEQRLMNKAQKRAFEQGLMEVIPRGRLVDRLEQMGFPEDVIVRMSQKQRESAAVRGMDWFDMNPIQQAQYITQPRSGVVEKAEGGGSWQREKQKLSKFVRM
jgi:hypothetical protein